MVIEKKYPNSVDRKMSKKGNTISYRARYKLQQFAVGTTPWLQQFTIGIVAIVAYIGRVSPWSCKVFESKHARLLIY